MQAPTDYRFRFAQERRASEIQAAADARLARSRDDSSFREPFRRTLGRRIMVIGARLAADPSLAPARSR